MLNDEILKDSFNKWLDDNENEFRRLFKEAILEMFSKYPKLETIEFSNSEDLDIFLEYKPDYHYTEVPPGFLDDYYMLQGWVESFVPRKFLLQVFPKECKVIMNREKIDFRYFKDEEEEGW